MIAAWMLWSAGIGVLFLGRPAWRPRGSSPTGAARRDGSGSSRERQRPQCRCCGFQGPRRNRPVSPPGYAPPLLEPLTVTVARRFVAPAPSTTCSCWAGWCSLRCWWSRFCSPSRAWSGREGRGSPARWAIAPCSGPGTPAPTIVGLLRPRVVVPAWVRAIASSEQELILTHEEEHIHAGDSRLRFLMTLAVLAFPWNPALWLQRHRLGLAIELDCDRRVMRRMPGHRHAYGNLLLRVGARPKRAASSGARVGCPRDGRNWSVASPGWRSRCPACRRLQGVLLVLGAAAIVALAVLFPRIRGEDTPVSDELVDLMAEPSFTPFHGASRPDKRGGGPAGHGGRVSSPVAGRRGIEGTVQVHLFIDTRGEVQRTLVAPDLVQARRSTRRPFGSPVSSGSPPRSTWTSWCPCGSRFH